MHHHDRPHALLVSWLFPPHNSIGAKRAYRFARNLPAHGWRATVLCGRQPPAHSVDRTPWSVPDEVRVLAEYDPAWLTTLANRLDARARRASARRPPADAAPAHPRTASASDRAPLGRTLLARAQSRAGELLHDALPTETIAVHLPHAVASALRSARADRPDVVLTTSYPYSAHLIGVALKRALGVPFVADLRDPWTLNFAHDRKLPHARWVERRLEALVFQHADRVTVTSETLARAYRERYPRHAHKFVTIRNGFEPAPLPARVPATAPARVVHFGHVYGARTMRGVYDALALVRARGALRPGELVVDNYGRLSDEDRAQVDRLGLQAFVHVREPLPYAAGIAQLREAALLLLPAWGTERGSLFVPGKLYDYLLVGAPVLALGQNPELAAILAHTRAGTLVAPDAVDAIAAALARAAAGTTPEAPDPDAVAEYSAAHGAARLAAVFDELASATRTGRADHSTSHHAPRAAATETDALP
jgi:glycosyltransferase involved in cell wall biosynthesis